jgi:hypothetical protein
MSYGYGDGPPPHGPTAGYDQPLVPRQSQEPPAEEYYRQPGSWQPQDGPATGYYQPPGPWQPQDTAATGRYQPPARQQPPGHRRARSQRGRAVVRIATGGLIVLGTGIAIGVAAGGTPASSAPAARPAATVTVTVTAHAKAPSTPVRSRPAGRHHLAASPAVSSSFTPAPPPSSPAPRRSSAAPSPAASSQPAASCYPLTNSGHCYEPGEYCRNSDHGARGVAGDGERIVCADNGGWRWEPY